MLLKITECCSLGCTHCLNDNKPDGEHMSERILMDSLNFIMKNAPKCELIVSGGEPTEHPDFLNFMRKILSLYHKPVIVATNGFWLLDHQQEAIDLTKYGTVFQVSTDRRYYPKRLPEHKKLWRLPGFEYCDDCVEMLTPQGRAKRMPHQRIGPSCFNLRAMYKQIEINGLLELIKNMEAHSKFCTPAIHVDGGISLGESDLCPRPVTIYDEEMIILKKIGDFKCNGCDNIKIPEPYASILA